MAKVYKVIAKVPAKVPSPNKNVAVSARISAGKERRTWMRIRRTLRGAAGNFRFAAAKGAAAMAKNAPSTVPVTDICMV